MEGLVTKGTRKKPLKYATAVENDECLSPCNFFFLCGVILFTQLFLGNFIAVKAVKSVNSNVLK
jgi:hypothetical protein